MIHYEFVWSEDEINRFSKEIWGEKDVGHAYFISLSARSKLLLPEEREIHKFPHSEMFNRSIIEHPDKLLQYVRRYECAEGSFLSLTGVPIPQKCIVVYANINPSNTVTALKQFQGVLQEYYVEITSNSLRGNEEKLNSTLDRLTKSHYILQDCYQKNPGRKNWVDVDCDTKEPDILNFLIFSFQEHKVDYKVIETQGGYHILLRRDSLKYNYNTTIDNTKRRADEMGVIYGDIKNNNNLMCPLPGTIQNGFKVRFVDI